MDTWSRGAAEQENGSVGARKGSAGMGFAGKGGVVVGCGSSVRDPLSREGKLAAGPAGAAEKFAAITRIAPGAGIPG